MDERSKFCCSICAANLNSKSGLKQHVNVLHKDIKYGCQHCGKQFSSKQYLTDHINNIHKRIKRKCYQCDKDFSFKVIQCPHEVCSWTTEIFLFFV